MVDTRRLAQAKCVQRRVQARNKDHANWFSRDPGCTNDSSTVKWFSPGNDSTNGTRRRPQALWIQRAWR